MDSILEKLRDPSWWFTSVVVAILVGSIREYAPKLASKVWSKYRQISDKRKETEKAHWEKFANQFINDPDFRAHAYYEKRVIDNRIMIGLITGFFFLVLASFRTELAPAFVVLSSIGIYYTTRFYFNTRTLGSNIREAWNILNTFHNMYDHTDTWLLTKKQTEASNSVSIPEE